MTPERLYLVNFALLGTHEIDSAFWHEWELFGLPGGVQLFLALNLALLVVGLVGFAHVARGERAGDFYALVLAIAGLTTCAIHGTFLASGHPAFRLPASLAVLAALLPVSVVQTWVAVQRMRGVSSRP